MPNTNPWSFAVDDYLPVKKMRRVRDDEPPPKRKRRLPVWGWLLIGVGGIVLTCGGGALAVATTMNRLVAKDDRAKAAKQADPKTKVWNQVELLAAVQGKSAAEVKALLGTPDSTFGGDPNVVEYSSFYYKDRVFDPHMGKVKGVWIQFVEKKASDISVI